MRSQRAIGAARPARLVSAAVALGLGVLGGTLLVEAMSPETERASSARLAEEFRAGVFALADDSMEGRGLGTEGIRRAAAWIESRLRASGLEPAFASGYRQPFRVKMGVRLGEGNLLEGVSERDWTPLGPSSSGEFAGELVFVGYGIGSRSVGYDELAGIDLKGKVALMLRYEPQERDDASPFEGKRPSRWSALRYKVLKAREMGAVAVIFATGPLQDEGKDKLPPLTNDGPESPAGIPVIQVKTSVARAWLSRVKVDLETFQRSVDRDLAPRSVPRTGIRISGRVSLNAEYVDTENVVGVLPGRGALADDVVVVGAHYDHLGLGGERSMRPNVTAVHSGADDNASGSVAALQAGAELKHLTAGLPDRRTLVIVLFSAEEVGLAGSSWFVAHSPFPGKRTVAMINLDMVGRLRENRLAVLGSESAPEWEAEVQRAAREAGLEVSSHGDGYGPSDQTSFYAAGVPVLHLFTGAHEQYHTPEDRPETIDVAGGARVVSFTTSLARHLVQDGTRLTYSRTTHASPLMTGDSRGYGAYLGTIPHYGAMDSAEGGVLLADVRAGGPADLAGLRAGDRIVEMAGTRIENLYDMTYALQDNKPGETITVVVVRGGQRIPLRATLGDRSAAGRVAAPGHAPSSAPADTGGAPATMASATDSSLSGPSPGPASSVPAFYEGRPGPDFRIEAGRPFPRRLEEENHLEDIRQLTFGGENAEAYFSPDGNRLIFQATRPVLSAGGSSMPETAAQGCDQQFVMDLGSGETRLVSSGKGRTTCGYYDWPEADRIIYSSTEAASEACPPQPDYSKGYVWALHEGYDIYEARPDGTGIRKLTDSPGYDAEATWCHRGGKLVFTSVRDGDLELYTMDEAGEVRRLTDEPGYDGGAFYSPDCREIVWRASRPRGAELDEYRALLAKALVRPQALEIFLMNADGSRVRQVTSNGAANFCPTFTADGGRILFASNAGSKDGREFDLWLIAKEGGEAERITHSPGFDGFPHFSPDGRWLVWSSNRADAASRETNLFIARWKD